MDDILSLLQDFDVANFLPAPEDYVQSLEGWVRFFVLIGPLLLAGLGAWYFFAPPKEANHSVGFRTYWGMGSIRAWLFAQKLAGMSFMGLGGVLFVIMLIVSLFFNGEKAMGMINTAFVCVLIQLVLVVALYIVLNLLIYRAFDKDGKPRK